MSDVSIQLMLVEVTRLVFGLLIALFHRPLAAFILEQERSLVAIARQRGVPLPSAPTPETARNLYFSIGIFVATYEMIRIWLLFR
ncbi:MAG TPA: hypothetical protein VN622_12045 [Clostridia bacterium]|nr:hypothetical protein [Clostridia bacterium]